MRTCMPAVCLPWAEKMMAMSAFWRRIISLAASAVGAIAVSVKYSDVRSASTARCVCGFMAAVTTTVRTFLTSVVMANPNSSISTTGIPKRMSIVRLSRRM